MKSVNIVLQGKGGVGKSLVAALLAQMYHEANEEVVCVDTDPVNATLSGYAKFKTRRLELMEGGRVSERTFDQMMEWILTQDSNFVVDNGASCFIPLASYMRENAAVEMIVNSGKRVVIHSVVTGGQALLDTLAGFDQLAEQMPKSAQIVVWLNEYFGLIKTTGGDGDEKTFEQMKVFERHRDRVHRLVRIPRQTADTFGRDMELMLKRKMTFDEAGASAEFPLMAKQRLAMMKRTLFEQMAAL